MQTIVICVSVHHGNTKQIADAIAEVLRAQVCTPDKADAAMLADYELIGFGSGIYYGKHTKAYSILLITSPRSTNKRSSFLPRRRARS